MTLKQECGHEMSEVEQGGTRERESVLAVFREMLGDMTSSWGSLDWNTSGSMLQRSRDVVAEKAPRLKKAVKFLSVDLVHWMNRGGPWRAFLITTMGIITLIGLTGLAAFLMFFLIATVNTVVIALLGSVAALGACVALFFAALTGIYIGALSIAMFVISSIAFVTIFAVMTAAGWIVFWWTAWQGVQKCLDLARGSISMTASTIQAVTSKAQIRVPVIAQKVH